MKRRFRTCGAIRERARSALNGNRDGIREDARDNAGDGVSEAAGSASGVLSRRYALT
jgi:hypothetical protein